MKGIILAGGKGTRLYPSTKAISKQLLPVYDKPMIYYPLSILMLSGIKDILIITTEFDMPLYKKLFENSMRYGINLKYKIQNKPSGLAEAFIIGEKFIGNDDVVLALGDNIFWGQGFTPVLKNAINKNKGATLFAYQVKDPSRFGVVEFTKDFKVISIEEKPKNPKSNFAVTGLYIYDNSVIEKAKKIKPSQRGELEISSINNKYLKNDEVDVEILGRGFAWLDTGTHDSLLEASNFVQTIENRQGYKIACLEEISFQNGWITKDELISLSKENNNTYSNYIRSLINEY